MAGREFGTDPYGTLARGVPGGGSSGRGGIGGSGVSVGRVGTPISLPGGSTAGTGFGSRITVPFKAAGKAKGGAVKKMAKGGSTASKRADGCATKGKTKGRFV